MNTKSSISRRIVWMIWLVFGFCLAIYQIQDRIVYYCSYPYNTEFQIRAAKELRFPQVTICKEDWMSKSKAKEFGIYDVFQKQLQMFNELFLFDRNDSNTSEYTDQWDPLKIRLHNLTKDWDKLRKNISHKWEDLVTHVSWNGVYNTSIVEELATDLGYCFTISSDTNPLIATEPGLRAGLELYLNAMQSDTVFTLTSSRGIFTGFRLLIHDPFEWPRMLEAGFVITPGTVSQVALTFENVTQLGPPYSNCTKNQYYRVVNCLASCEDRFFLNECKCQPFYYVEPNNTAEQLPVCSLVEHEGCLLKYQSNRTTSDNHQCDCSQQCHGRIYDYNLSQSKISQKMLNLVQTVTGYFSRILGGKENSSEDENNTEPDLTIIYIYFPYLSYKDVTAVESYSFLQLLCDVGGALSLLLGATLLTVYEIAEFLALVARDFLCSRLKN